MAANEYVGYDVDSSGKMVFPTESEDRFLNSEFGMRNAERKKDGK
jgi:hypothetical protein